MAEISDVHVLTFALGVLTGTNKQLPLFQAPSASEGGGVTVVAAKAWAGSALAGAGTTSTLALIKGTAVGTANGTISAAALGSATQWGSAVPQAFDVSGTARWVAAGEYVWVQYDTLNSGAITNGYVQLHYVTGRT